MQKENKAQLIDLEKVIRNQKNKFVRNLPKPIINFIKFVVRQKALNEIIINNSDKFGTDFIKASLVHINGSIDLKNKEKLPNTGRYIFVSNHPLGAADYAALITVLSKKYSEIKVIANEVLTNVKSFGDMIMPVGVFAKTDSKAMEIINNTFSSSKIQIITFPAGLVSRKINGKIQDLPWHRSFIRNAIEYKRDIVPILVDAKNSKLFYSVAAIRNFFRIKAKIELFLLPSEFFKKRNKTIPVTIGDPISYKEFDESKTHLEWAQEIKKRVYKLRS